MHGKSARFGLDANLLMMALAGVVALAGCSAPVGTGRTSASVEPAAAPCATAEGSAVYTNDDIGFCFAYPETLSLRENRPGSIVVDSTPQDAEPLAPVPPFALVNVTVDVGQTAGEIAEGYLADLEGFEVEQSTTVIGGETAFVLDNVPGQDINRLVIVVHNGVFYELMFSPADPEVEGYEGMLALYDTLTASLTFLP